MIDEKEKTALGTSVGADAGQSIQSQTTQIIAGETPEINDLEDIFSRKIFPPDAANAGPGLSAYGFYE